MKNVKKSYRWMLASAALLAPTVLAPSTPVLASDHADTAMNFNGGNSVADLTDLYIFPSPQNPNNVVMVMDVFGLIPAGQGASKSFGTDVLYQFKIDVAGGNVNREDLVIQAKFEGTGANQRVRIAGPVRPSRIGGVNVFETPLGGVGTINRTFEPTPGMRVFAGARQDPFFIDLERLFQIFPDRATPIQPPQPRTDRLEAQTPSPNQPRLTSFRPAGQARDFLANFNVLSIVVELPKSSLSLQSSPTTGPQVIKVWMTTSLASTGGTFIQQDRLARPVVNEVFASVTAQRHAINNRIQPNDDPHQIGRDIVQFMTGTAGRSRAITAVVQSVLVPDVMTADLSQTGPAAYLGVETNGATGGRFGGRKLQDDVVDMSLGVIFGNTISQLGLAPDDGNAIPSLTTDNVGPGSKGFTNSFPYLGNPR